MRLAFPLLSFVILIAIGQRALPEEFAALNSAVLPFDKVPRATLAESPKKVIAHWHSFPLIYYADPPFDGYEAWLDPAGFNGQYFTSGGYVRNRPVHFPKGGKSAAYADVQLAAEIGIDGFFVNFWYGPEDWRWRKELTALFDAADAYSRQESPGFAVAPNIDSFILAMEMKKNPDDERYRPDRFADNIAQFKDRRSFMKMNGRFVIGVFAIEDMPPDWYERFIARLESAHQMKIYLTGIFVDPTKRDAYASIMQAYSRMDVLPHTQVQSEISDREWARRHGMMFVGGVGHAYNLPLHAITVETAGFHTEMSSWKRAMSDNADAVHIITWNDHYEGTNLRPNTGSQYAYYDIAAYYIAWFKTGVQPPIVRNVLYYGHRVHATGAQYDTSKQAEPTKSKNGVPFENKVYLLGFLNSPGTMQIISGGVVTAQSVTPGIRTLSAPFAADDQPRFKFIVEGDAVIDFPSAFRTRKNVIWQDLYYRAGSSSREPVVGVQNNLPEDRWKR